MASNKELIAEAGELASVLHIEVDTDGLNNKALSALVSDLKAKVRDAENVTQADALAPEAPEAPAPVATGKLHVAGGKSLAVKRGIISEGAEVREGDLSPEAIETFLTSGHIVRN